ncbi:hypothetical protein [Vibrio breoganii]|nr:hypothetical protein [Vibrio breoganii]
MKKTMLVLFGSAVFSAGAVAFDYGSVIDSIYINDRHGEIHQDALAGGAGKNAQVEAPEHVSSADVAGTATTVATAERSSIKSTALNTYQLAGATNAATAGTATRVSDAERNLIIAEASRRVCVAMPNSGAWTTVTDVCVAGGNRNITTKTWQKQYAWTGSVCKGTDVLIRSHLQVIGRDCTGSGGNK